MSKLLGFLCTHLRYHEWYFGQKTETSSWLGETECKKRTQWSRDSLYPQEASFNPESGHAS